MKGSNTECLLLKGLIEKQIAECERTISYFMQKKADFLHDIGMLQIKDVTGNKLTL